MPRHLIHLIAIGSSIVLMGACSRVETGRTTHLNNQKSLLEAETEFQNSNRMLSEAEQAQLDLMNGEKMRNHFAGGFDQAKNADGTSKMQTDKRSGFEEKKYGEGENDFLNKKFKTKEFAGKSFNDGSKKFDTSIWKKENALDDMKLDTPEFAKRQSDFRKDNGEFQGKEYADLKGKSEESGKEWDQLSNVKNPEHLMNKYTEDKADNIAKPDIISMQEAKLKTVEDIRSMMGRD